MSNSDLTYQIEKEVPEWVFLDEQKRKLVLETGNDQKLFGSKVAIKIKVSFKELSEILSLTVVFMQQ